MGYYSADVHRSAPGSEGSRLHGTGRVTDDLYLIAHHEISGRSYLSPRAVGIGLAGGLLAELLAAQSPVLTLDHGCLLPLYRRGSGPARRYAHPDEPVTAHVLDLIVAESPPRPVRDWLLFLGQTSAADVAGRLERSGYLTRPKGWLPWRSPRPVPVDGDWVAEAGLDPAIVDEAVEAARRSA
jgi:Golgi phosphoprotein 3 (GPP34)